jgi:hypothetical protein
MRFGPSTDKPEPLRRFFQREIALYMLQRDISKLRLRSHRSLSDTFSSVQPRVKDPSTHVVYTNQKDLFSSLKMTALGNSSVYHSWHADSQCFVQIGVKEGERGLLLLDGKDEVISDR